MAHDGAVNSFTSSLSVLSEVSALSSLPSTSSSKATTPVDTDARSSRIDAKQPPQISHQNQHQPSYRRDIDRLALNILPKSSIPSDLPVREYARECVWAAESSRLNPYALHPEEYHLFRHHISHTQVTTYLNIRNSILRLWMLQPLQFVKREAAIGCANARWFDAASVCYDWLIRRGYINFGCVSIPEPVSTNSWQKLLQQGSPTRKRKTIAVIGAGMSGLGCARQLDGLFRQHADRFRDRGEDPPRIVVIEGRSRVGGRVYSREFKTKPAEADPSFHGKRYTAEMGGMIITGFDRGNPLNILVRGQLGLAYHGLSPETTIYDSSGTPVDPVRDDLVEKLYNDCLDRVSEFKYKVQPSKLIEGNRELIDEGRDSPGDGSKTIMQAEEATAALPHAPPVSKQSVPEQVNMIPVSSDKLTGRVHMQPGVAATLKASDKARLMGWEVKSGPSAADSDTIDLRPATEADGATLGSVLDYAISQYKSLVDLNPLDHRLINWHIANLEYSNATSLQKLSLPLWDIDAGNEWEGQHTMVVGGYQSVARGLVHFPEPLDLRTQAPVTTIRYNPVDYEGSATIECDDGTVVEADSIVCTVPLGVLKQGSVTFDPPLPPWKSGAVERLGFGILNKVVLVYDRVFWDADRHIFGVLRDASNRHSTAQSDYASNRGRFFQWFNVSKTSGLPCLIALMAGDAGFDTEHSSNDSLVAEATMLLSSIFRDVPNPVEAIVTRWGSDRFARGSYSSAAPGMQPDDYDAMARPVGNLYFAGEHTSGTHPATVHGAYLSGLRAASEVFEAMQGPIEVPTPLVLPKDSLILHKRKKAAMDPRQARLEAYEMELWDHIRCRIGDRPLPPVKPAMNPYQLFSKDHFEEARRMCEANRSSSGGGGSKHRSLPNEVRNMTSRMWRAVPPEARKPYDNHAAANKREYAEVMEEHTRLLEKWDAAAASLRAAYEKEHPSVPGPYELASQDAQQPQAKHRRARPVSYAEK